MANVDAAFGLRPVRHMTGGMPARLSATKYSFVNTYATIVGLGDLVTTSSTTNQIERGAASGTFTGVFAGVSYSLSDGTVTFAKRWPGAVTGATNIKASVYDDPYLIFDVQNDSIGATPAVTDYGTTADVVVTGDANSVTGVSQMELDTSDIGTGINFKILGLSQRVDNEEAAAFAVYEVLINEHQLRGTLTAV